MHFSTGTPSTETRPKAHGLFGTRQQHSGQHVQWHEPPAASRGHSLDQLSIDQNPPLGEDIWSRGSLQVEGAHAHDSLGQDLQELLGPRARQAAGCLYLWVQLGVERIERQRREGWGSGKKTSCSISLWPSTILARVKTSASESPAATHKIWKVASSWNLNGRTGMRHVSRVGCELSGSDSDSSPSGGAPSGGPSGPSGKSAGSAGACSRTNAVSVRSTMGSTGTERSGAGRAVGVSAWVRAWRPRALSGAGPHHHCHHSISRSHAWQDLGPHQDQRYEPGGRPCGLGSLL